MFPHDVTPKHSKPHFSFKVFKLDILASKLNSTQTTRTTTCRVARQNVSTDEKKTLNVQENASQRENMPAYNAPAPVMTFASHLYFDGS